MKALIGMIQCFGCNKICDHTSKISLKLLHKVSVQSEDMFLKFTTCFLCLHSDSLKRKIVFAATFKSSSENRNWECATCKHDSHLTAHLKWCVYKLTQAAEGYKHETPHRCQTSFSELKKTSCELRDLSQKLLLHKVRISLFNSWLSSPWNSFASTAALYEQYEIKSEQNKIHFIFWVQCCLDWMDPRSEAALIAGVRVLIQEAEWKEYRLRKLVGE